MSLLSSVSHGFIFKMGSKKCRGLHIISEDYVFLTVKLFLTCLHILPWSCDPVWSPDQKPTCLPEPKGRSWQLQQGNPGLWSHQKYQVCGPIKYFPYRLKLGR